MCAYDVRTFEQSLIRGVLMPNCTKCGQPLKEGAKFCEECGAPVNYCAKCGALLKEGTAFCGACGAAANEFASYSGASVSPSVSQADPIAAQAAMALAYVRFTLPKPFFARIVDFLPVVWFTNTIFIDGYVLRTIQMGETVDLEVPIGQHVMLFEHAYRSLTTLGITISRKSNPLELTVAAESMPMVIGVYNYLWQKFYLNLQGYMPLR
jgi:uncharacterized OB-fold protein